MVFLFREKQKSFSSKAGALFIIYNAPQATQKKRPAKADLYNYLDIKLLI